MVTLYMGGQKVAWADAEKVFAESAGPRLIELRHDAGEVVAHVTPTRDDPEWVRVITPEEIERRMAEPGLTLDEYRAQAGWQRRSPLSRLLAALQAASPSTQSTQCVGFACALG